MCRRPHHSMPSPATHLEQPINTLIWEPKSALLACLCHHYRLVRQADAPAQSTSKSGQKLPRWSCQRWYWRFLLLSKKGHAFGSLSASIGIHFAGSETRTAPLPNSYIRLSRSTLPSPTVCHSAWSIKQLAQNCLGRCRFGRRPFVTVVELTSWNRG